MVSVCGTCHGLQKHLKNSDTAQEKDNDTLKWADTTLPSLRASGTNCRACALMLNGILLHHERLANISEDSVRIKAETFPSRPGRIFQDHLSIEVRWKEQGAQHDDCQDDDHEHVRYPDLKLEFFTDGDGQSSFSAIGRGRPVSDSPLHDAGLSKVQGMIKNCLSSHARCRQSKPTTLPKRILDLLLGPDSKSVVLHESQWNENEQRYEHGEYVALSHVWGVGKLPKTTKQNLRSHLKGIAWDTLPRAFQEAVALTRALGIRYLWVDSLCLLQDDIQAKLEESVRMDEVFGNAFLTIAATSATDSGSQPLFPAKTQPFKIQATDNKGQLSKVYVREQPNHYSFKAPFDEGSHMNEWELPFNMSKDANVHTPLLKRAWAYTERLLSPRVIHFTKSEMILECREGYNCECGRIDDTTFDTRTTDSIKQEFARVVSEANTQPQTHGSNNPVDRRIDGMTSQLAGTSIASGPPDLFCKRDDALQLWSYIITEFTARNLTYDERLTAIAGIAKALLPAMQSGYIAGQWTFSTLSLLWYPNDSTRCRRPKPMDGQNIPSWSWASCEGSPVFFDNASAMDLACRASFGPKGKRASAWSPVQGEPLNLSAAMATEVTFNATGSDSQQIYILTKNRIAVEFTPDIVPLRGEDALQDGDTVVCALISMTYRSSITGLVLKSASDNTYRRVGRFECYECSPEENGDEMSEDAEALFGHWFPEIQDMTQLDNLPQRQFTVV
ncbi:heterokaryon incompatibility protein-domain-containing protein [Ampelomyces quisqualis]|uniref:Heterokaryon incompatibility protein-domain-containing protein n=1 Tax=Ampelomyces quisqualis TaxID=50730 RepID=A0A6A5QIA3_AMPQU|nr:heterokaryon incompatibility protein-domain-containing protein [Ampelomyces quisqualis]